MPDIDIAIHAALMVEEQFIPDQDEEETAPGTANSEQEDVASMMDQEDALVEGTEGNEAVEGQVTETKRKKSRAHL